MQSISPVFTESEIPFERKVAENQAEYMTVIGLPVSLQLIDRATGKSTIVNPWGMSFRFCLTDDERAAVAAGSDLILTQLNFGKEVTPMNVQFCAEGVRPFFGETPVAGTLQLVEQIRDTGEMLAADEPSESTSTHVNCPGCETCNSEGKTMDEMMPGHYGRPTNLEVYGTETGPFLLDDEREPLKATVNDETIAQTNEPSAADLDAVEAERSIADGTGSTE